MIDWRFREIFLPHAIINNYFWNFHRLEALVENSIKESKEFQSLEALRVVEVFQSGIPGQAVQALKQIEVVRS